MVLAGFGISAGTAKTESTLMDIASSCPFRSKMIPRRAETSSVLCCWCCARCSKLP